MSKSLWVSVGIALIALGACNARDNGRDVGPLNDAAPAGYDAGTPPMDSGMVGIGTTYVRLANFIPASPNLTVCIATIPGTGIPPTPAHIIGQPDARLMSDGTLPSPAVSPYLPAPVFGTPGFGYQLRLYNRNDVHFAALGPCPDAGASPRPLGVIHIDAAHVMIDHHYTAALIGVLPGTPVMCPGTCPAVRAVMFEDSLEPPTPGRVAVRLFQAVPNLPGPIHVCFDFDYRVVGGVVMDGPSPPSRVLPPLSAGPSGLAFGEVTDFIEIPPVTSVGAFYTHLTVSGTPDCDLSTRLLGPVTVPLPVPASAPREVARIFIANDVITNFAFGRVGAPCTRASDCVAPSSVCTAAACTCDMTHHCVDDLAGNLLPWRDVQSDLPVDAGVVADSGVDAGH